MYSNLWARDPTSHWHNSLVSYHCLWWFAQNIFPFPLIFTWSFEFLVNNTKNGMMKCILTMKNNANTTFGQLVYSVLHPIGIMLQKQWPLSPCGCLSWNDTSQREENGKIWTFFLVSRKRNKKTVLDDRVSSHCCFYSFLPKLAKILTNYWCIWLF